jgi:hypothetical protein
VKPVFAIHTEHRSRARKRLQERMRVSRRRSPSPVPGMVLAMALGIAACHHATAPASPGVTIVPGAYLLTGVDGEGLPAWVPSCFGCSDSIKVLPDTFWLGATGGFKWQVSFEGEPLLRIPTLFQGSIVGDGVTYPALMADGVSSLGGAVRIGSIISAATDSFVVQSMNIIVLGAPHVYGFHRRE